MIYITKLNKDDAISLADFLNKKRFWAGEGYEIEGPPDEWVVWVRTNGTTKQKINNAIKEWKNT